jgi:hypothetical protein
VTVALVVTVVTVLTVVTVVTVVTIVLDEAKLRSQAQEGEVNAPRNNGELRF